VNVENYGTHAYTKKSSASKAQAIAADIAKFAKGATNSAKLGRYGSLTALFSSDASVA
jgi:hypothetical protein